MTMRRGREEVPRSALRSDVYSVVCEVEEGLMVREDQAKKGAGWMPGHRTARKDVASCEKQWGAASERRSMDIRMGKPGRGKARSSRGEYIAPARRTRGTETSKYPEEKETTVIPPVAASDRGGAQTVGAQKAAAVVLTGL